MGTIDLYRVTGETRYRELAKRFLDLRDVVPPGGGDDNQSDIDRRQPLTSPARNTYGQASHSVRD